MVSGMLLCMIFEVLVVFHGAPAASPGEAVLDEKAVAEIAFLDFVAIGFTTIGVGFGVGGFNDLTAVLAITDIGVIEWVDVDGEASGMF